MQETLLPLPAGSPAPDFTLTDVLSGQTVHLADLRGQPVIVDFWSVECPWSRYYDAYFVERAPAWADRGLRLLFIASNATEDAYEMQDLAESLGITHPVLHDRGNVVADAYGVQTTPHCFLIDGEGRIVYQGAVDDRSFHQQVATIPYLDAAVEALLAGRAPSPADTPAYGCALVRDFGEG